MHWPGAGCASMHAAGMGQGGPLTADRASHAALLIRLQIIVAPGAERNRGRGRR